MKATKIKMKLYCGSSKNVQDIDSAGTYWKKERVHDYLKMFPRSIQVNIFPYPYLVPATSQSDEKYVRSEANNTTADNLLKLPRE